MDESSVASVERLEQSDYPNMIWIPGGTFRMGSDKHYPEEAPAHRVTVGGFWDRPHAGDEPAVQAVRPRHRPQDLGGNSARSEELSRCITAYALCRLASLHAAASSRRSEKLWRVVGVPEGCKLAPSLRAEEQHQRSGLLTQLCMSLTPMHSPTPNGRARSCRPRLNGNTPPEVVSTAPSSPGAMNSLPEASIAPIPGREISQTKIAARMVLIAPHR